MEEIWKIMQDFPRYEVSSYGNVRVQNYRRGTGKRILSPSKSSNGYMVVVLCVGKQRRTMYVHRLVAMNFISNSLCKPQVNHKDGNKANNSVENLEWVTRRENIRHSFIILGRKSPTKGKVGKLSKVSKPVMQFYKGKKVAEYNSIKEASFTTGVDIVSISYACRGIVKVSGGFKWKFKPK